MIARPQASFSFSGLYRPRASGSAAKRLNGRRGPAILFFRTNSGYEDGSLKTSFLEIVRMEGTPLARLVSADVMGTTKCYLLEIVGQTGLLNEELRRPVTRT
ncbi:hypothetical protein AHiyo4_20840 [Arthrobacter sp. Hiyo4]|nr:hypothetical protein AHiyo4_20840 [Arthrobacter sp. Hiyo4]